jgi:hypothetical protein
MGGLLQGTSDLTHAIRRVAHPLGWGVSKGNHTLDGCGTRNQTVVE